MPPENGHDPSRSSGEQTASLTSSAHDAGTRIGPYRVLSLLGEGGFGVVYLAEQTKPVQRRVAVKVIKPGMDTRAVLARFEAEEQALALMDHPNVAHVYDAGTTEPAAGGRPYFVMEHVTGVPITEHCDRHRLSINERLELFTQVCDAVQHAHQKGVIHRDIKPGNILVAVQDGKGVPKVIDFGVAKAISQPLTQRTLFTEEGQLIGTPSYMSPEQAERTAQDVDTRTDIYSLGVLLYELLTGALPLDPASLRQAAFDEIMRIIREVEPQKPSTKLTTAITASGDDSTAAARNRRADPRTLTRELRGDLDWITMKALEKDRTRRYASAAGLAADIQRHLRHEPVVAGPPSAAYRVRKFVRRNQGVAAAGAVIALVLLAATVVSIGFALSEAEQRRIAEAAEQEQNRARQEAEEARDNLQVVVDFQSSMLSETDPEQMGRGIFANLRDAIREALEARNASPEDIHQALASLDTSLRGVNATNLALKVIDEHVLSRASETIEKDFADQPLVRAALQQTVADTYRDIGRYPPAMPLQEAALQTHRAELGDDHPETLRSIDNMGNLLWAMGSYAEAEAYYREALEGRRRVLGKSHRETLISIRNMGSVLESMGKLEEALGYYREAEDSCLELHGDGGPSVAALRLKQGRLLEQVEQPDQALRTYDRAVRLLDRSLERHPIRADLLTAMGDLYRDKGQQEIAKRLWQDAFRILRATYGPSRPTLQPFRKDLEASRRALGDDHPDTLSLINTMGHVLQSMGQLANAESYYREALERSRRVLGDDHPRTLMTMINMGSLLLEKGKLEESASFLRDGLKEFIVAFGEEDWRVATTRTHLGECFTKQERHEEAEQQLLTAHRVFSATFGEHHKHTKTALKRIISLYEAWGKPEQAAEWRAKLEQWQATTQPATTQPSEAE